MPGWEPGEALETKKGEVVEAEGMVEGEEWLSLPPSMGMWKIYLLQNIKKFVEFFDLH